MSDDARAFSFQIAPGTISDKVLADYNEQKVAMEKAKTARLNGAKTAIQYLASTLSIGKSGKVQTVAEYESYWSENVRGIGTGMALLLQDYPDLAPLLRQAAKQWNESNKPKKDQDVPAAVNATVQLAQSMADVIKKK